VIRNGERVRFSCTDILNLERKSEGRRVTLTFISTEKEREKEKEEKKRVNVTRLAHGVPGKRYLISSAIARRGDKKNQKKKSWLGFASIMGEGGGKRGEKKGRAIGRARSRNSGYFCRKKRPGKEARAGPLSTHKRKGKEGRGSSTVDRSRKDRAGEIPKKGSKGKVERSPANREKGGSG